MRFRDQNSMPETTTDVVRTVFVKFRVDEWFGLYNYCEETWARENNFGPFKM